MSAFGWKGSSGFSARSTAEQVTQGVDASVLTAIVTGATSGIGTETARVLALRGVHVVMAVRNTKAGGDVKEAIIEQIPTAKIDVMELDLSSMASVRNFASQFISRGLPLNILINNAGVLTLKSKVSKDNIELNFATNHIGHFLLTNLLLETMKKTVQETNKEGRIINISSSIHHCFKEIHFNETSCDKWMSYKGSKLANILHANELSRRLKEAGVEITANSLHPGMIYTNIFCKTCCFGINVADILIMATKPFLKTIQQGAATTCYLALNPQVKGISGQYFVDCNIAKASSNAMNPQLAKQLWDYSLSLTNEN